jgi:hypothetical protein
VSSPGLIRLRYRASCSVCGAELPPRSEARWDSQAKRATCRTCAERTDGSTEDVPAADVPEGSGGTEELQRGVAGASAARRYERLRERRDQQVRERFGRLSRVYLALTNEPQSTRAWATGSEGERALGRYLDKLHDGASIIVLHDRRIPRTRANIDHIAITATGIYVIDAKNYTGKVQRVDKGGWLSTDRRLYVGRRDCSKIIDGMAKQVEAIRAATGELIDEFDLKAHPTLCFVDAEWSLLARPFEIGGVWVGWAKALGERLQAPGPLEPDQVRLIGERVAAHLRPA